MTKKSPLEKLIVNTLGEPFYLNVMKLQNDDRWFPMIEDRFAGSRSKGEAVRMRADALKDLQLTGSPDWKAKELKTVKITLYH